MIGYEVDNTGAIAGLGLTAAEAKIFELGWSLGMMNGLQFCRSAITCGDISCRDDWDAVIKQVAEEFGVRVCKFADSRRQDPCAGCRPGGDACMMCANHPDVREIIDGEEANDEQ